MPPRVFLLRHGVSGGPTVSVPPASALQTTTLDFISRFRPAMRPNRRMHHVERLQDDCDGFLEGTCRLRRSLRPIGGMDRELDSVVCSSRSATFGWSCTSPGGLMAWASSCVEAIVHLCRRFSHPALYADQRDLPHSLVGLWKRSGCTEGRPAYHAHCTVTHADLVSLTSCRKRSITSDRPFLRPITACLTQNSRAYVLFSVSSSFLLLSNLSN